MGLAPIGSGGRWRVVLVHTDAGAGDDDLEAPHLVLLERRHGDLGAKVLVRDPAGQVESTRLAGVGAHQLERASRVGLSASSAPVGRDAFDRRAGLVDDRQVDGPEGEVLDGAGRGLAREDVAPGDAEQRLEVEPARGIGVREALFHQALPRRRGDHVGVPALGDVRVLRPGEVVAVPLGPDVATDRRVAESFGEGLVGSEEAERALGERVRRRLQKDRLGGGRGLGRRGGGRRAGGLPGLDGDRSRVWCGRRPPPPEGQGGHGRAEE